MPNSFANILAIETASPACSVALAVDGERYEQCEVGNNIHSQVLLGMVDHVLQEAALEPADLQLVAAGQGPGSFTGLRIGIGVAQGLAFGANCPMLGLSSMDALAAQVNGDGQIIAGLDARMGEVYWAEYQKQGKQVQRLTDLQVTPPVLVNSSVRDVVLVGNAWSEYAEWLSQELRKFAIQQTEIVYPSAAALLSLVLDKLSAEDDLNKLLIDPIDFAPEYVRDNVAKKSVT